MGYSLALQKAESIIDFPFHIYFPFLYFTIFLFIGFLVLYIAKFIERLRP